MKRLITTLLLAMACSFSVFLACRSSQRNIAMAADQAVGKMLRTPDGSSYPKAPAFELEDQYGQTHDYRFPRKRLSLLAFGDRAGSEQIADWIHPIYQRYEKRIEILGVADLSAAPGFLRGMIRKAFRSKLDYPVMLDWSGEISKNYGYRSGKANIFLVDEHGRIVLVKLGKANAPDLNQIYQTVDKLLQKG